MKNEHCSNNINVIILRLLIFLLSLEKNITNNKLKQTNLADINVVVH